MLLPFELSLKSLLLLDELEEEIEYDDRTKVDGLSLNHS
ncbi:hypothetical protein J2769_001747 [Acinetobacter guillouiae]|nr:hypothetical protein [Acinetobacter guillouiae]